MISGEAISIWADDTGESIIIGYDSVKPGDNFLLVPLTQENILDWIKVLVGMLDDGDIRDVPGTVETVAEKALEDSGGG